MKEMWTGIYPNKKEYKYEIRFRTDDEHAYLFVQEACRNAIDTTWFDEKLAQEETEDKKETENFRWLRVDNTVYEIIKTPIVELECECGCITHRFNIQDMVDNWNTAGIFTCGECHRRITYELLK